MKKSPLTRLLFGSGEEVLLPETRRESFSFYGKECFFKILICGIMTSTFFFPLIVWIYSQNYLKSLRTAALDTNSSEYISDMAELMLQHSYKTYLIAILLIAFAFIGLVGLFGFIKKVIFCQSEKISEYFLAIKDNFLPAILTGLLLGLSLFLFNINLTYFSYADIGGLARGILIGISALQLLITFIVCIYLLCGMVVYTNTLKSSVANAIKLTFALFFKNALTVIGFMLPIVIMILVPSPWQTILLALILTFYIGFCALGLSCYANSVFDRYINPTLGEKFVGIGLNK